MDSLSRTAVINFKHAKDGKSFIPSVPVNYAFSGKQKAGKSFIPRFTVIYSKQTKNGKPSLFHASHPDSKKDKPIYNEPVKNRKSYIPRKATKKVEPYAQEKAQQMVIKPKAASSLFGKKSKLPVPTLTKKTNVSRRASHSRTCTVCTPAKKVEKARKVEKVKKVKKVKKVEKVEKVEKLEKLEKGEKVDVRALPFNAVQNDDQIRFLALNAIKRNDTQIVLTFDIIKDDIPSTTTKGSLISVRNLCTLFKKRVSPLQPSTPASIKKDELNCISTITPDKKANDLSLISLKNKHINKPEASISISHNNVEVSTTTSIIRPELSSISLLHKAEKDLSSTKNQSEEDGEDASSSLFGNVVKTIVRFSKDLFSKMI